MQLKPIDIFTEYLVNEPTDIKGYFDDCISFIVGEANRKNIEFDGYFQQRWEDMADTIIHFDNEYFDNMDRKKLYVYLSCLVDDEIYGYLNDAYNVAFNISKLPTPTKDELQNEINLLIANGTKF